MLEIVVAGVLAYVAGILVLGLRRYPSVRAMGLGLSCLAVLLLLAGLNFELGIIDQKVAATYAFDHVLRPPGSTSHLTFAAQGVLNLPAFLVTGAWWAAIGTNSAIVALVFTWLLDRENELAWWFLGPAVVNFALFSLRDLLIGVLLLVLTLDTVRRPERLPGPLAWACLVALAITRPELAFVYGVARVLIWSLRVTHGVERLVLAPVMVILLVVGLQLAPATIGLESGANPVETVELLDGFVASRTERHVTETADGSYILGGRVVEMPIVARLPIQVLAFFVLPFPFEIRSISLALAFADSLWLGAFLWRYRARMTMPVVVLAGLMVVSVAFFSGNYGNLFRLRMPLYFVAAAAFRVGVERRSDSSSAQDDDEALPRTPAETPSAGITPPPTVTA